MALAQMREIKNQRTFAPTLFDIPAIQQIDQKENSFFNQQSSIKQSVNNHNTSIDQALKTIFLDSKEENRLLQARKVLGDIALDISDEELTRCITEFQYLLDLWLDEYEKQVFDNKTLNQILKEGQYGSANR